MARCAETASRFSQHSWLRQRWLWLLCIAALYSVVATPLLICFSRFRYQGHLEVEGTLDAIFILDFIIRLRTTHVDVGGQAFTARASAMRYLCRYGQVDALAAMPFEQLTSFAACSGGRCSASTVEGLRWIHMLRVLRGRHILSELEQIQGANVLRVVQMLVGFLVFAHYLGCARAF